MLIFKSLVGANYTTTRFLREIGSVNSADMDQVSHVRGVTYIAATGGIRHVWNLGSDTTLLSASLDGQRLVIAVHRGTVGARVRVFLFDTRTGRSQDVPSNWFEVDDYLAWAEISGNGRLVSTYSESGPRNGPVVVSVYNWRTEKSSFQTIVRAARSSIRRRAV